ncbi:hypothetical protein [Micromonospora sp. ATA51]|uniref:hypothetical protein n=1 Tax=Micromonospora sp. ATA51 TaxID=2806098 RepID=UPI0035CC8506
MLTSGRVAGADPAIGLETQVTARPESGLWAESCRLAPELRAIVALCATRSRSPRSPPGRGCTSA